MKGCFSTNSHLHHDHDHDLQCCLAALQCTPVSRHDWKERSSSSIWKEYSRWGNDDGDDKDISFYNDDDFYDDNHNAHDNQVYNFSANLTMIFQGDTERLAKFKIRIEDPPRRKDMVMTSSLLTLTSSESKPILACLYFILIMISIFI